MRFLLAGTLAALTAAGLASIRPAVLPEEERAAAAAIRENRMRADTGFLASAALERWASAGHGDVLGRGYVASRFEAIGLEPGGTGGSWEQPLELGGAASRGTGANVIGLLRGRDPELSREAVVYTAHQERDNASGVATLLAIAEAFAALPERPRRSLLFAAVGGEEGGLLGSSRLARKPPAPVDRIAVNLDVDGIDLRGRTHDVHVAVGPSSLDDWIRAIAETQGRVVVPEAFPDQGPDHRFDPLSFARIGVPSAYLARHHPVTDDVAADRDFSGAIEDARLLFHVGARVAEAELGR